MKLTFFFSALLLSAWTNAQKIDQCLSHKAIEYQEKLTPGFKAQVEKQFGIAKKWSQNEKSTGIHTIPVVVHVVYNTSAQNLPDSVILSQIQVLNEDYNRLNADTVNMRADFEPVKGNPQIQFMLAQIDPSGNPTSGITRTQTSTTSFGSFALALGDFSDLEKVKSTADGGHDPWDQNRYLNIWVCNMAVTILGQETPFLLGYATPPAGLPNWPAGQTPVLGDGVVIQYQAFGRNNPNPLDFGQGALPVKGRTPVHEVGHYLGLRHIWGDGDCTQEDGIDDTPNAADQSQQDCDPSKNTCVDDIAGADLPDMIENYMDYSAEDCQNSFTQGQVDLMHGVLENQRYDLVHNNPANITNQQAEMWSVYPNPVNELLVIKGQSGDKVTGKITNLKGNLIEEFERQGNSTEINFSSYDSGIYFLLLDSGTALSVHKIIKY